MDASVLSVLPTGVPAKLEAPVRPAVSPAVARLLQSSDCGAAGGAVKAVVRTAPPAPAPAADPKKPKAEDDTKPVTVAAAAVPQDLTRLPHVSCRELVADVAWLDRTWLGKQVPFELGSPVGRKGKLAAMAACCGTTAPGVCPSFSTLSGIAQWTNAIVLFVNVGGDDYDNVFAHSLSDVCGGGGGDDPPGAVYMTWFAQRSHSEESGVVRLLVGSRADDPGAPAPRKADPRPFVLLFCRLPQEPYVYCGRLAYCAHGYVDESPCLRFVWRLADAKRLCEDSQPFRDMLAAPLKKP